MLGQLFEVLQLATDSDDKQCVFNVLRTNWPSTHIEVVSNNIAALEFLFSTGKYRHRSSVSLPTLLLLDVHLSQQNNFDLLQVINSYIRTSKLPLIVFTESAREALTATHYGTDVHHSIQKPIRADELRGVIQAITD